MGYKISCFCKENSLEKVIKSKNIYLDNTGVKKEEEIVERKKEKLYASSTKTKNSEINYEKKKDLPLYNIKILEIDTQKKSISRHSSDILKLIKGNLKTILIYGDKESGKTSLVLKICENEFQNFYIPSFCDEITKKELMFNYCQKIFECNFIVTNNINSIQVANCYIVLFDLTNMKSYNFGKNLIENQLFITNKNIIFIGNKSDLSDKINISDDLLCFCQKFNCIYFEISLKENSGINAVLHKLGEIFGLDTD